MPEPCGAPSPAERGLQGVLRPNAAAASRSAAARGLPLPPGGRSPAPPGPPALPPPCPKYTQNTPKMHPPAGSASALGLGRLAAVYSWVFPCRPCLCGIGCARRPIPCCRVVALCTATHPGDVSWHPDGCRLGWLSSQRLCRIMNRSLKPPRQLQALGLHTSVLNRAGCLVP